MKALKPALMVALISILALWLALAMACGDDDDDSENEDVDDDMDDDLNDDDVDDDIDDDLNDDANDDVDDDLNDDIDDDVNDDVDDDDDGYCAQPEADCSLAEAADEVEFYAGVAVPRDIDDPRMEIVPEHFNSITAENALKWGSLTNGLGNYNFDRADALLDWAEEKGLRIRGHVLVWGKYPGSGHPSDLPELIDEATDPAAFTLDAIRTHIATVVGRYAGRIETWDVVNEPLSVIGTGFERNIFYEAAGPEYIAEAFYAARQADPSVKLFLNEFFYTYDSPKAGAFIALLEDLVDQGVPIDGVGIQGHVYLTLPQSDALGNFLSAIEDLGLETELTELDVAKVAIIGRILDGMDMYAVQADVYNVLTSACTKTPLCNGITVWGIDDDHTWLDSQFPFDYFAPNEPLLLDGSLEPKPAYYLMRDAIAHRGKY